MEKISLTISQDKSAKRVKNKPAGKPREKKKMRWWQWLLIVLSCLVVVVVVALAFVINAYLEMTKTLEVSARVVEIEARQVFDALKAQDLALTNQKLQDTRSALESAQDSYRSFNSLRTLVPGAAEYFSDGDSAFLAGFAALDAADKAIVTITPYAEMLGFGEKEVAGEDEDATTQDRITRLLSMLGVVGPGLDEVMASLEEANTHIHSIDASKYPEVLDEVPFLRKYLEARDRADLADLRVRDTIIQIQDALDLAITTFAEYRPVIEKLPAMAGAENKRMKYLVIFQNDNELRPTGGFLTAYSIIWMEDGKVAPEKSDDIYELDKKFKNNTAIPEKLGRYLTTEKYWNLRDMNIDPDFKLSMEEFLPKYLTVPGEPNDIDGVIVVDTYVLTELIRVLGPVELPGYGTFTVEPDKKYGVPDVIVALSEIITRPTPYIREDRKGILGPMMQALLSKVYGAPNQSFPDLFQVVLASLEGRHVQVYFLDEELQEAAEKINIAGRMIAPTDGSDFLAIVDANLGGAKSNLFITYDVVQTVGVPEGGVLEKNVVITQKNSRPGDNCNLEAGLLCLNATNNNWQRLYLPLGSELISARGFKNQPEVYEENGFTVVDGFFALSPNSTAKVELNYTVPYTNQTDYVLNIWKQSGVESVSHLIDVNDNQEEIVVKGDTVFRAQF